MNHIEKITAAALAVMLMFPAAAYAAEDGDIYHSTINTDWEEDIYCVVKTDGTLYKIPHTENTVEVSLNEMISTQVTDNVISCEGSYVLKEDGTVWEFDETTGGFDKITDDVKEIACGGSHALFVKNDNTLWGVGDNSCGQLAQGEMDKPLEEQIQEDLKYKNETKCAPEKIEEPVKIMENVKSAAAYGTVSVVLKTDGTVWTFGADTGGGALGIGGRWLVNNEPTQILSNIKDIFVQGEAGFAVDNDDTLWRWGSNYAGYAGGNPYDRLTPEKYMENVKYASNMSGYNLIIKTDNSLWIYGDTDADNGDIGYSSSEEPFKLADDAVCALGLNEYFLTEYENDRILVLQTNGDLMLYAIPMLEDKEPYLIGKVTGNVRLPNEIPASINFTDITDKSDEAQKAVNALTRAGIIRGVSDTEFAPDAAVTRAEAAALLLRMTAQSDADGNGGFSDVTEDMWYYDTAGASKKYGIISGFEDNTFRGDDRISKVQLISLAARALKNERNVTASETEFSYDVPEWAAEDIATALDSGLITENDLSDLNTPISRADAAVILYRLYDII